MGNQNTIYLVLMGVSGCGKSTFSAMLARDFGIPVFEGDDFHPKANIDKMASGVPLEDTDRSAWLAALTRAVRQTGAPKAVIACSALNDFVQAYLNAHLPAPPLYVWLDAPKSVISARLDARRAHFMPPSLLNSQFNALSPPKGAIHIANGGSVAETYAKLVRALANYL